MTNKKFSIALIFTLFFSLFATYSSAQQTLTLQVTNLTNGMHFTPRLVVLHDDTLDLFEPGTAPSRALAWLAEGGVITTGTPVAGVVTATAQDATNQNFAGILSAAPNSTNNIFRQFGGPLAPSTSSPMYPAIPVGSFTRLSVLTMLIPTNDAFAGLDSIRIPTTPGTYTYNLNAYDAGSEANDEISAARNDLTGITLGGYALPGMAGSGAPFITEVLDNRGNAAGARLGSAGTGVDVASASTPFTGANGIEGLVHIHRNVLGDTDPNGGVSDLDSRVHRWLNPVARLTVIVQ